MPVLSSTSTGVETYQLIIIINPGTINSARPIPMAREVRMARATSGNSTSIAARMHSARPARRPSASATTARVNTAWVKAEMTVPSTRLKRITVTSSVVKLSDWPITTADAYAEPRVGIAPNNSASRKVTAGLCLIVDNARSNTRPSDNPSPVLLSMTVAT